MDPRLMLRCVLTFPALGTVVALAGSREAWLGSALALSPLCQLYLFQVPQTERQRLGLCLEGLTKFESKPE